MLGTRHRIARAGLAAEYQIALRIGSGAVGSSFAIRLNDRWFQSPISWYAQTSQFRVSPGYELEKHPDFDRPIRDECLSCHGSTEGAHVAAIGCERCHGDGRTHALQPTRANIVNPSRLAAAARDSVCEQCHLAGVARILNPGARAASYQPGQKLEDVWTTFVTESAGFRVTSHAEQFAQSICVQKTSGGFWCGTCHNAHPTSARPRRQIDAVCQDCHQPHENGASSCAGCHMPKRPVSDVAHTAYTDHRIQWRSLPEQRNAAELRAWRPSPGQYTTRNRALALFEWGQQNRNPAFLKRAADLLASLPSSAQDARMLAAQGLIELERSSASEAVRYLEHAVKLDPQEANLHFQLGLAKQADGEPARALAHFRNALEKDPYSLDATSAAAQLQRSLGDKEGYRKTLESYLRFVPQSLTARQALKRN